MVAKRQNEKQGLIIVTFGIAAMAETSAIITGGIAGNMLNKKDILPIFVKDFISATNGQTDSEVGSYIRLLMKQWDCGGIDLDIQKLKRVAYSSEENWEFLKTKFKEVDGVLKNERMEKIRAIWENDFHYKPKRIRQAKLSNKIAEIDEAFKQRRQAFAETLKPYIDNPYSREMILEFYEYWTEPNKSRTQFKQETMKTWDLNLRLKKWSKNNFNGNGNTKSANTRGAANGYLGNKSSLVELASRSAEFLENRSAQLGTGSDQSQLL